MSDSEPDSWDDAEDVGQGTGPIGGDSGAARASADSFDSLDDSDGYGSVTDDEQSEPHDSDKIEQGSGQAVRVEKGNEGSDTDQADVAPEAAEADVTPTPEKADIAPAADGADEVIPEKADVDETADKDTPDISQAESNEVSQVSNEGDHEEQDNAAVEKVQKAEHVEHVSPDNKEREESGMSQEEREESDRQLEEKPEEQPDKESLLLLEGGMKFVHLRDELAPAEPVRGPFRYYAVHKPQFVTATMWFRTIMLWKKASGCDDGGVGVARFKRIKKLLFKFLGRDFRKAKWDELQDELSTEQENKEAKDFDYDIADFLQLLNRLQLGFLDLEANRGAQMAKERKRLQIDDASLYGNDDSSLVDFNSLGCCGRRCFDAKSAWKKRTAQQRHGLIPLWRKGFTQIEARFGGSVVSYFHFAQSVFWANFLTSLLFVPILVPHLLQYNLKETNSYVGLLIGSGMEQSWLFYGNYKPLYFDFYRMDLVWVAVSVVMLVANLLYALSNMDSRFDIREEDIENFKFSREVFTGFDHNITSRTYNSIQRSALVTNLGDLLSASTEDQVWDEKVKTDPNFQVKRNVKKALGVFLTLLFSAASTGCVGFLVLYEERVINSLQGRPEFRYVAALFVPSVISFFKVLSPRAIKAIANLELFRKEADKFKAVFFRMFLIRMFYVLVVLFQVLSRTVTEAEGETCKQTRVGMIYYRMLTVDVVMALLAQVIYPFVMLRLQYCCGVHRRVGNREDKIDGEDDELEKVHFSDLDKRKGPFKIPDSICDIMYTQALVWSGTPFCPFLPFWAVVCSFFLIHLKIFTVKHLCRVPVKPLGIASQNHYFRGLLVVTLGLSVIPFSFFLRQQVDCGPHAGSSPLAILFDWVRTFPSWFVLAFDYSQNSVLLSLVVLLLVIYALFSKRLESLHREQLYVLRDRMKVELSEKQSILRASGVMLDRDKNKGRRLFLEWQNNLGAFGTKYRPKFEEKHFGDLLELASLNHAELRELIQSWRSDSFIVPEAHLLFFIDQIDRRRILLNKKNA